MNSKIFIILAALLTAVPGILEALASAGLISTTLVALGSSAAVALAAALQKQKKAPAIEPGQ